MNPKPVDLASLENQLAQLQEQQAEIRRQLRESRKGGSSLRKLEEKLAGQFAAAKWTVQQIQQLQPDWDDQGFYAAVTAQEPTPRGRRPRTATPDRGAE